MSECRPNENDSFDQNKRSNLQQVQYEFQLDIQIRKIPSKCLLQTDEKSIYEAEWIDRDGPPIVLVEFIGIEPRRKSWYYVQLSNHPHIIRTYGIVHSNERSMRFLQEYPPQGNLSELLRENEFKPNEKVLLEIFEQICDGIIYLINQNLLHGHLICQNILLFQINPINPKRNLIKLTDFGLTTINQLYSIIDHSSSTILNTISTRYSPPEFLEENLRQLNQTEKSDIYSMGYLMWEALNDGQFPYEDINDHQIIRRDKIQGKILPKPSKCNEQLWNIIQQCWNIQPNQRPTFQSLKQDIQQLRSQSIDRLQSETFHSLTNTDPTMISLQLERNDHPKENEERYYSDDGSVDSSELTNGGTSNVSCPFCQENFPSLKKLHDHLIQCGTKTDQCPKCERFIQRAIFAYHYENNCALIDQPNQDQISRSNLYNSSELVQCEFCKNYSILSEYQMHRNYCLDNPENRKNRTDDLLGGIPCQFCQKNYSTERLDEHQKSCRKNPNRMTSSPPSTDHSAEELPTDDEKICCTCL